MATTQRLGDHLTAIDAARFTGRAAQIAQFDRLLAGEGPERVVLVHGPGGIGKSALLRAVGRRAAAGGRPVWSLDARTLQPVPGELERALAGAADRPGAVVLVDSFEMIPMQAGLLRDRVLPGLAADALVVVAGRQPPDRAWFRAGWEHVCVEVAVPPLPASEARALLAALGVADDERAADIIEWAAGSPLALTLAAPTGAARRIEAGTHDPDAVGNPGAGVDLTRMIVRRLADDELSDVDADVLEVAAVARAVDGRLLSAVLPGRPTRAANERLRASSVAELVGARVALHELVRTGLRDELRRRDRPRYDRLRCRIADHLYARVVAGEPRLLSDLIDLIDDPEVRWGIGGSAGHTCRIEPWHPDDVDDMAAAFLDDKGDPGWWDDLAPVLAAAPESGLVARDVDGTPLGFCVSMPALRAPAMARDDRILGPILADARARGPERALIFRETFSLRADAVIGVLNLAAVLRSGLANVERSYIVDCSDGLASSIDFFKAVGAVHHPSLDAVHEGRRMRCWIIEHGPGGMVGQVRDVIRAEAGLAAPPEAERVDEDLVGLAVEAVRDFCRPAALAASPLAPPGATTDERVERLRSAVRDAVAAAFGSGSDDETARRIVELADLDPSVTHEQAAARLAMSRATYFRHLRQARRRAAVALVDRLRPDLQA
ncbi:MAG TPA: AAA family ATPase [Acidimicrobiales bacterium]|nr:AAA family ATPase [Acidimicrobiales bacterium]